MGTVKLYQGPEDQEKRKSCLRKFSESYLRIYNKQQGSWRSPEELANGIKVHISTVKRTTLDCVQGATGHKQANINSILIQCALHL